MQKEKKFLECEELIEEIKNKNIIINDEEIVRRILCENNYYVIMGYKSIFLDENHCYKDNVTFENIYNLYLFDRKLKLLLLNSLFDIENIIKTSIINQFAKNYGFKETDYLNKKNYNCNHKYIDKTFNILYKQIEENSNNNLAVVYYKKNYGYVPLWVIIKVLSFGLIKELYSIMKDNDKEKIKNKISNFKDIKIKGVFTFMQLLVDIRNKTAHDEIVYNHCHRKILLPKTMEYYKFNLTGNQGLNDMFGVLISIKNFLPKNKFNCLIDKLTNIIDKYLDENKIITRKIFLKEFHLPSNFGNLRW